jgi:hypothetical protein
MRVFASPCLCQPLAGSGLDLVVVQGGAPGVDQSFSVAGRELVITLEPHIVDGKGLGIVAGAVRNREMVEACYLHRYTARFRLSYLSPYMPLRVVKKSVATLPNLLLIS